MEIRLNSLLYGIFFLGFRQAKFVKTTECNSVRLCWELEEPKGPKEPNQNLTSDPSHSKRI
jgi:hypothetical protein